MSLPDLAGFQIATLKAGMRAMGGVDGLRQLTPQQVFNVVAAYRETLDSFEREAEQELVRGGGEVRSAATG